MDIEKALKISAMAIASLLVAFQVYSASGQVPQIASDVQELKTRLAVLESQFGYIQTQLSKIDRKLERK